MSSIVTALNRMNSVEVGEKVLGSLISSKNSFNFKNEFPRDKNGNIVSHAEAAFVKNENGGGDILAAHLSLTNTEYWIMCLMNCFMDINMKMAKKIILVMKLRPTCTVVLFIRTI